MHVEEIIGKFQGAKKIGDKSYQCKCTAHADKQASLTITEEDDKILMYCHAGCTLESILRTSGLNEKDLFNNKTEKTRLVTEYIYTDEDGKPLYKVQRFEPKNFVQAKYDNGKWIYKMAGVRYVLYNLPNVIKADKVYFVEGEKDADNLNRLGFCATTTVSGASSFNKRASDYIPFLKNKNVVIIPDNDKSGVTYAENIQKALKSILVDSKIIKLSDEIEDLPEKADISDVILKYGKEKALEILEKLEKVNENEEKNKEEVSILDETSIFSIKMFEELYEFECNDEEKYLEKYGEIKKYCKDKRITGFDKSYRDFKIRKKTAIEELSFGEKLLIFPKFQTPYKTKKYQIDSETGFIYEIKPEVGRRLVSYQLIFPIEKYSNFEQGTEKIKLSYMINDDWRTLIVDKSVISSSQSIVKLSDFGIKVNSENAKDLIRYLAEIEALNSDIIPVSTSVSKLGWTDEETLIPYSDKFEFDNEKDFPNMKKRFGTKGTLEEWVEFFKDKRKYNSASRIIMAAGVSSILLNRIKQNGFLTHIWGGSELGKSVACMAAQSIFGNPEQNSDKGIGINFNFTLAGLEYRLNLYNNIPLFVNELQHQKEIRDYDKILFLVAEGKGKSRSTKYGGIAQENSWNNIMITNGEKNIINSSSNAGAFNRCISIELKNYTFENLSEVADFSREHYGTAIREILEHIDEYDCKSIYKKFLADLKDEDTSEKRKILIAILLTGDKILTDIVFKDNDYLDYEAFKDDLLSKDVIATDNRALDVIRDWYASEQRHFLSEKDDAENDKFELYGRKTKTGDVAFISTVLKNKLIANNFDPNEVINAWEKKKYLVTDKNRSTKIVKINCTSTRCIVFKAEVIRIAEETEEDIMPF